MHIKLRPPGVEQLIAFAMAALLVVSASYWALRWDAADRTELLQLAVPEASFDESASPADPAALARLLNADQTGAAESGLQGGRFTLTGIVADTDGRGIALLSEDGKSVRAHRVGGTVAHGLVLHSVAPRRAMLAASIDGPVVVTLEMPPQAR